MKNKFIKTTFCLLIGGAITKLLSMIIKIILSRNVSTEVLGLYMTIMPTFSLLITLSQFGLPTALSKLVAEDNKSNKQLFLSILPILLITNIFIMIFIFMFAKTLAITFLKQEALYLGIIAMALVIPFTSISSLVGSYYFGSSRVFPHILSHIVECIVRLLLYYFYLPTLAFKSYSYIICFLILSNVLSELASIIVLISFLPKNIEIKKRDFLPRLDYVKSSLEIGIPNTAGRLIGSIGYFFEPIILTCALTLAGYSNNYITYNYGVITGYVIPIVLLPSFFTMTISQALLPSISKDYANNKIKSVKRKLKLAIMISLLIGSVFTFFFVSFPSYFLNIIYHTTSGSTYLRILAPIVLFQYVQAPISASLDAMGKSTIVMRGTLYGTIARCSLLFILSLLGIGMYGLIISTAINVLIVTIYDFLSIEKLVSQ